MQNQDQRKARLRRLASTAQRELFENPSRFIELHTTQTGHPFTEHIAVSEHGLLNRVLSGRKTGDTRFTSVEIYENYVTDILAANM